MYLYEIETMYSIRIMKKGGQTFVDTVPLNDKSTYSYSKLY